MNILVCIPTWKRDTLGQVLEALEKQTSEDFDVLIVGDAGEVFLQRKLRITYHQTDKSLAESLNLGLCHAIRYGYKWIIFLDDDAVPVASYIERFVAACKHEVCIGGPCSLSREERGAIPKIHFDGSVSGNLEEFYRKTPQSVDHLKGCNWALQMDTVKLLTLKFDEGLSRVAFRSETDVQFRLKKAGFWITWHPDLAVNHLNQKTGSFEEYEKDDFWRGYDHAHFTLKNFGLLRSMAGILLTGRHPKPIWIGVPLSILGIRRGYHAWYTGYLYRLKGGKSR